MNFSLGQLLHAPKLGLCLLVITCILFDFSAQACFNPCESLIYDVCKGTPQESSCFFVYSFMTSFGNEYSSLKKQKLNSSIVLGGCLGYLITPTDWTESFLSNYMQGQEKLTFIVILLFFSITLCCTLISANEKIYDIPDEQSTGIDTNLIDSFFLIHLLKYILRTVSNSVRTILTMPFVLRRLTLAECCSWYANERLNMISPSL